MDSSEAGRLQPLPAGDGREGARHVGIQKKGNSQCKGPEAGVYTVFKEKQGDQGS